MKRLINPHRIPEFLDKLENFYVNTRYNPSTHRIHLIDELNNKILYIRLPITLNWNEIQHKVMENSSPYILLLVQSGSCALGLFKSGETIHHKVIKSYMVRKKQGKSQIKYLKTRGKSRAGSRVRLANTERFFNEIHEKILTYLERHNVNRIGISCSKSLLPFLFNDQLKLALKKTDERLFKIPMDVPVPNFKVLIKTHHFLQQGELHIPDSFDQKEYLLSFLG